MIKDIMHGHIGDKKENTLVAHLKRKKKKDNQSFYLAVQVLHFTEHGFYDCT